MIDNVIVTTWWLKKAKYQIKFFYNTEQNAKKKNQGI